MPEIIIAVQNKLPILAGAAQHIVADNSDYTIRFLFDDQWEEGEKTVYFVRSNGYAYAPVKTVDGVVQVPVQTDVNLMSQLLIGVRQGDVKTSRPCGIAVYPAISNVIKDDAVQPDESLWEQVIDRLDELEKNGGGGSGSGGGIYIGPEETMPAGTKVRIDPNGKKVEIPQIDDTLTMQGYAADAKAVGDALSKVKGAEVTAENIKTALGYTPANDEVVEGLSEEIHNQSKELTNVLYSELPLTWEVGVIDSTTGNGYDATNRARTNNFIDARNAAIVTSRKTKVFAYDSRYRFIGATADWWDSDKSNSEILAMGEDVRYIRLVTPIFTGETLEDATAGIAVLAEKQAQKASERIDGIEQKLTERTVAEYPVEWKQGYIIASGAVAVGSKLGVYADRFKVSEFIEATTGNKLYFSIFAYDADGAFIGTKHAFVRSGAFTQENVYSLFPDAYEMQIMVFYNSNIETPVADVEQYTKVYCVAHVSVKAQADRQFAEIDKQEYWTKQRQRFSDKPIMIAYSHGADLGYINTELAYINAAIAGFQWLKADVQPTSDGKLVMCHDDGFTFDADGYITTFSNSNKTLIHDMTYAECMALEYAKTYQIDTDYTTSPATKIMYRPKVCDLEQFLTVCKEFEVRPCIVIRTDYMDVVVPELLRLLEAYDFTDNCIVNSFALDSVRQVAEQSNHRVMISVVKEYAQGTGLTVEEVDNILAASPNCTINIYTGTNTEAWNNVKLAEASAEAIEYAKSFGMVVGTAFVSEPHKLYSKGIGLMQCNTLCIQPKATPIALCVSLLNGVATVEPYGAYGRRFTADVSVSGAKLIVTNVRLLGSDREFADGITPNLANVFPYTLSATGDNVQSADLKFNCRIDVEFDTTISDLDTSSKKRIFIKFAYGI